MVKAPRRRLGLPIPKRRDRLLLVAALMFFGWATFDGTISYIAPLLITERGYSEALMGLIIASSSVAGAGFDIVLARFLTNPNWRFVFFLMFVSGAATVFVLWHSSTIPLLLLAMALWGLYYNLSNFGVYDFVSRNAAVDERGKENGVMEAFKFLGYIVAPLAIGFLMVETVTPQVFLFIAGAFVFALCVYIFLEYSAGGGEVIHHRIERASTRTALHSIWRDGALIAPVLVMVMAYNAFEAFFWTIGPLLALHFAELHPWNGLFVSGYFLPLLFSGWIVDRITPRFGKKRTAFISFAIGGLILSSFFFVQNPYALIGIVMLTSLFTTFALPSINGALADYIAEDRRDETRIEAMADFSANIGYIVGPALAGVLTWLFGATSALGVAGILAAAIAFQLLLVTPRHINLVPLKRA